MKAAIIRKVDGMIHKHSGEIAAICEPLSGLHIRCLYGIHSPGDVVQIGYWIDGDGEAKLAQYSRIVRRAHHATVARLVRIARNSDSLRDAPIAKGHWYEVLED